MSTFEERKTVSLNTMSEHDRSKKGSVDEPIKKLLSIINEKNEHYTTSSCSGRILLLVEPESKKKNEYEWPLVTHEVAKKEAFIQELHKLTNTKGTVWFRMQTAIIHVASKNLEAANQLVKMFYAHGWKRTGIFSTENDVMTEILSVEKMDVPVMKDGKQLVNDEYIEFLVEEANNKLRTVHKKLVEAEKRCAALK